MLLSRSHCPAFFQRLTVQNSWLSLIHLNYSGDPPLEGKAVNVLPTIRPPLARLIGGFYDVLGSQSVPEYQFTSFLLFFKFSVPLHPFIAISLDGNLPWLLDR
ncbi:hypothetical protein [Streptomyces sp. NPDC048277]|uniref:hypothetical protein n=1 Tax=Streptomyces sp. NPDC048277 TaxID=3155027 RepID=UPI0034063E11